jgi:hypothetical protein
LINLIKNVVVESNEENLESVLVKVEKALILLKSEFIEQQIHKIFDDFTTPEK